jgi:phosphoserine phosphatase RsbX
MDLVTMPTVDFHLAVRPFENAAHCGDAGLIKEFEDKVFFGIIDGAGHGKNAEIVAVACRDYLIKNYNQKLSTLILNLHELAQKKTRPAVTALCRLDLASGELTYTGVGNIVTRIFGPNYMKFVPADGLLGYRYRTPKEHKTQLFDGDLLLMHSDGIKEHFRLEQYPGLIVDDTKTITKEIISRFSKAEDDASCLALRYHK